MRRVIAIVVLGVVALIAVRLAVGLLFGLVTALAWVIGLVALAAAGVWAYRTLDRGRTPRATEPARPAAALTHEDRVDRELERLRAQMRDQH